MTLSILLLRYIIPVYSINRMSNISIVLIYTIIGVIVYAFYMWRVKVIENIFGKNIIKRFLKRK